MLSGDMLGTTWGDEEGTVPPEPQFAKLCRGYPKLCSYSIREFAKFEEVNVEFMDSGGSLL